MRRAAVLAMLAMLAACASAPNAATQVPASAAASPDDTTGANILPAGYGSLRQDDIAVQVALVGGVTARVTPLDEGILRLLAPDSYRSLREYREGRRVQIQQIARRFGLARTSVWLVSYYGTEQGDARFSPQEVIITNAGRDFPPVDIVPLTPGFGEQRVRQRAQQSALYVFDGALDVNQSQLTITVEGTPDVTWGSAILPRIERERALVRSRAERGTPTKATSVPQRPTL